MNDLAITEEQYQELISQLEIINQLIKTLKTQVDDMKVRLENKTGGE